MTVLRWIVWLVINLFFLDSETSSNALALCFSSDLVSAIAEIQISQDRKVSTDISTLSNWHSASCKLKLLRLNNPGPMEILLCRRLADFLGDTKHNRKARLTKSRLRFIVLVRKRNAGRIFDSTLGLPGEG